MSENKEKEVVEEIKEETTEEVNNTDSDDLSLVKKLREDNEKLSTDMETLKDRLLRLTAEYENFRKRTAKEKEGIYTDACVDVLKEIIPNLDNLERALLAEGDYEALKKGVEMTQKGFTNSLDKLKVETIDTESGFDPNMHQALMHVQDENLGANVVAEVLMKGYKRGDKVIRHSMVKVAN